MEAIGIKVPFESEGRDWTPFLSNEDEMVCGRVSFELPPETKTEVDWNEISDTL